MKQGLTLLLAHLSVGIAEHKADRGEEVTLARPITTDDYIMLGREGLDDGLLFVAVRAQYVDAIHVMIARSRTF